jgi:Spy/CpxP family protein refolding chaperone
MRKTLITLMLAAALPAAAIAAQDARDHDGPPPFAGPHGEHGGPRMFKDLDLTKEQRLKIGELMGENMRSRHDIDRKYLDKLPEADKKAMQAELKSAREKQDKDLRALLTPEQQKKFDEQKKDMEAKRADREEFEAWKAKRDKLQ